MALLINELFAVPLMQQFVASDVTINFELLVLLNVHKKPSVVISSMDMHASYPSGIMNPGGHSDMRQLSSMVAVPVLCANHDSSVSDFELLAVRYILLLVSLSKGVVGSFSQLPQISSARRQR